MESLIMIWLGLIDLGIIILIKMTGEILYGIENYYQIGVMEGLNQRDY